MGKMKTMYKYVWYAQGFRQDCYGVGFSERAYPTAEDAKKAFEIFQSAYYNRPQRYNDPNYRWSIEDSYPSFYGVETVFIMVDEMFVNADSIVCTAYKGAKKWYVMATHPEHTLELFTECPDVITAPFDVMYIFGTIGSPQDWMDV